MIILNGYENKKLLKDLIFMLEFALSGSLFIIGLYHLIILLYLPVCILTDTPLPQILSDVLITSLNDFFLKFVTFFCIFFISCSLVYSYRLLKLQCFWCGSKLEENGQILSECPICREIPLNELLVMKIRSKFFRGPHVKIVLDKDWNIIKRIEF
ncbi:MAG: hypothetical protein EAX96_02695 [Candidatus Lokiarchaeota archaeon]|nr:hypothetical protein [Candidatus Lokiarchaeota archaeon]